MKILIVVYIKSEVLLQDFEGIMQFDKFQVIESNRSFRVFTGHFNGHAIEYFKKLSKQLDEFIFDIEDSIFISYPAMTENKKATISMIVVKRKGNKHLRELRHN